MHFSLKFSDLLKSKEVQVLDSPRGLLTLQPDNLLQQVPRCHYTKSDLKTVLDLPKYLEPINVATCLMCREKTLKFKEQEKDKEKMSRMIVTFL